MTATMVDNWLVEMCIREVSSQDGKFYKTQLWGETCTSNVVYEEQERIQGKLLKLVPSSEEPNLSIL
jgi:hypothetical protein